MFECIYIYLNDVNVESIWNFKNKCVHEMWCEDNGKAYWLALNCVLMMIKHLKECFLASLENEFWRLPNAVLGILIFI